MASTNKTTNYELSQYIGTDKPTYLTDYNQDMSKIDTGIHEAKTEADSNAAAIGTLSNLATTAKNNLVAAINEVEGATETNADNIATNISNIATNTNAIGTLSNLNTTAKNNLVAAANEINSKAGNLSNLDTTDKTSLVNAVNEVRNEVYKQKRVTLASGEFKPGTGSNIITLSEDFRNYDDLIIGGRLLSYIVGQQILATDKIILNREYVIYAGRTKDLYLSITYKFNSYTEIEVVRDESSWAGNPGVIEFVEGQHL